MDIGFIVITGLLTSFHCVAMCGTMVATYAIRDSASSDKRFAAGPHIVYHSAKLISYTAVGFVLGAIGAALNLGAIRGTASLLAGAFMILLGLSMLNIHPAFRAFSFRMPQRFMRILFKDRGEEAGRYTAPLVFGLLTGFMPCGPLQAMQLYAAGTGSPILGAATMFLFGVMTIPMMLAFGAATQALGHTFKKRVMTAGAVIVMIFGVVMVNRGLLLAGSPITLQMMRTNVVAGLGLGSTSTGTGAAAVNGDVQEATLIIENTRYVPDVLNVTAGIPVRLTVDRREDNVCSDEIVFPGLDVRKRLTPNGITVVEFTAPQAGSIPFTCQMGMMSGTLVVSEPGAAVASGGGADGSGADASGADAAAGAGAQSPVSPQAVAANRMLLMMVIVFAGVIGYKEWTRRRTGAGERPTSAGGKPKEEKQDQPKWRREVIWVVAAIAVAVVLGYAVGAIRSRSQVASGPPSANAGSAQAAPTQETPFYDPSGLKPAGDTSGLTGDGEGTAEVAEDGASQTFTLGVESGYQPATIKAAAGIPLKLTVQRNEDVWCSKYLVFPKLGIEQELPDSGSVDIDIPALEAGTYAFTCQMDMLSGELVVE